MATIKPAPDNSQQVIEDAIAAGLRGEPLPEPAPVSDPGASVAIPAGPAPAASLSVAAPEEGTVAGAPPETAPGTQAEPLPAPGAALPEHYEVLGLKLTPAEMDYALNTARFMAARSPEELAAMNEALLKLHVPAPPVGPPVPVAPVPASTPPVADPYEDPAITALKAQVAELRAHIVNVQPTLQPAPVPLQMDSALQQQRAEIAQAVAQEFVTGYDLTPAELELLAQRSALSGEWERAQSVSTDFRTQVHTALDRQLWTDPFFRDKAIARLAAKSTAPTADELAERRAASTALGGTPGSSPRETAPLTGPLTRQQQIDGMAKDIAVAMGQG